MASVCRRLAQFFAYTNLGAAVLILCQITALHFWLPVSLSTASPFIHMSLLERIEPRALVGTLLQALSTHSPTQGRLLTIVNMLALFSWLICVLKIVEQQTRSDQEPTKSAAIRVFWVILFSFSVNPYNAFVGLFVDMPAAALVAATTLICLRSERRVFGWQIGLVTIIAFTATLVHEKSIFDLLILFLWLSERRGPGVAARLLVPTLLLAAAFLLLAAKPTGWGLPTKEYAAYALSLHNPILAKSLNVWGMVFGGGAFWLVYLLLGQIWRRQAGTQSERMRRTVLMGGMALLCIAQLGVAWDTNRLTALIWLPVALVASVMPIERGLLPLHLAGTCVALLLFQLSMPPSLVFDNGMVPYNCYASAVADQLPKKSEVSQVSNLSLIVYDQNYMTITMAKRCR
jgi:hypothetical protein